MRVDAFHFGIPAVMAFPQWINKKIAAGTALPLANPSPLGPEVHIPEFCARNLRRKHSEGTVFALKRQKPGFSRHAEISGKKLEICRNWDLKMLKNVLFCRQTAVLFVRLAQIL